MRTGSGVTWRRAVVTVTAAGLLAASAGTATGNPRGAGREDDAGSGGGVIWSEVQVSSNSPGGSGSVPLNSRSVSWTPPACWMQPLYSPEEFAELMADATAHPESAQSDWLAEIREADYYQGEDGHWWQLVYNQHLPEEDARDQCHLYLGNPVWVETGETPEQGEPISPELLADIAYAATRLPRPVVELSPPPALQKVNLDIHAAISADALPERVVTTASIDFAGIQYASTVVAVPTRLRMDAGTEHADPAVCTYRLSGGSLDTAGERCNITYRKTSGSGTYPMEAQLTWEVYWTASADPDGPREAGLPEGYSVAEHDVTVREVQTIVR